MLKNNVRLSRVAVNRHPYLSDMFTRTIPRCHAINKNIICFLDLSPSDDIGNKGDEIG